MGCWKSTSAGNDETPPRANRTRDNRVVRVRKPESWVNPDGVLASSRLQEMRNEFWQNAVQSGGRPEIWAALRAATEGDLSNAQRIIEDNRITLGEIDMSVCYDDGESRDTRFDMRPNMVRKPTPWRYVVGPLSRAELQEMRNEFWQNVVRSNSRPGTIIGQICEIWEALKAATESDLLIAQKLIDDHKIRLGNPDMSVCYDDSGTRYELPLFVLSEPTNMDYRVLNVR